MTDYLDYTPEVRAAMLTGQTPAYDAAVTGRQTHLHWYADAQEIFNSAGIRGIARAWAARALLGDRRFVICRDLRGRMSYVLVGPERPVFGSLVCVIFRGGSRVMRRGVLRSGALCERN